MNVYDFDNTIYAGESAIDFFFFCAHKKKSLLKYLPVVITKLIKYKLCIISKEEIIKHIEKYTNDMLLLFPNIDEEVEEFWNKNMSKIKNFYLKEKKEDDVILSASFSFLLLPCINRLGIKSLISSEIDFETGKITRLCFKEKKVPFFTERFGNENDITFYTDSYNDKPMIEFSKHAYYVKGENIKKIK